MRSAALALALLTLACSGGPPVADPGPTAPGNTAGSAAGSAVVAPPAASDSPIQDLLTAPELAPYWHADRPGRVPVRIVENPLSTDRPVFAMHGAPVQWIPASAATAGTAYVEVGFQLVDGLLDLTARYPIEGVTARATYVPLTPSGWRRSGPIRLVEN